MPGSLRSLGISHFHELTKEPPALISWGNANSASLRWRFPSRGGGERYGLARLRSLAVSMIGRAHRSSPPQTPTTTPVGGLLPPVSPPPASAPHPCYIFDHLRSLGPNDKGQLLLSRPLSLGRTPLRGLKITHPCSALIGRSRDDFRDLTRFNV